MGYTRIIQQHLMFITESGIWFKKTLYFQNFVRPVNRGCGG